MTGPAREAALTVAIRRAKRAADLAQQTVRELRAAQTPGRVIGHIRCRTPAERDRALDLVRIAADGQEVDVVVLMSPRPHQHGAKENP